MYTLRVGNKEREREGEGVGGSLVDVDSSSSW